jgi:hypothetical protein
MNENKTSRYLKYAIGEIVLVMIGILLALQVNSWNQNRLERLEEKAILKSLHSDFIETRNRANQTIQKQSRVVDYCDKMMLLMLDKPDNINRDSIADYMFSGTLAYWRVEPVNGTYDALIGSGKTGIIQNQDLSQLLAEFSAELKYGFEDENYSIELNTLLTEKASAYAPFLLNEKRLKRIGSKNEFDAKVWKDAVSTHLNNNSFLTGLYEKAIIERYRLEYQQSILNYVTKILISIESELKLKQ